METGRGRSRPIRTPGQDDVQWPLSEIRLSTRRRVPPTGRRAVTGGKNAQSPQFRQRSVPLADWFPFEKVTTNRWRRPHRVGDRPSQQGPGQVRERTSMIRSPALKPASILGHRASIAPRSALVRQLPKRIQMKRAFAAGTFAN
jgi:hypothetical protein